MSNVKIAKTNQSLIRKAKSRQSGKFKSKSTVMPPGLFTTEMQEKCQKYYKESYTKYKHYFLTCVREIEDLQPNAFACIQISRFFTSGVLPKYCHIPDPLKPKQRQRVEQLLRE